MNQFLDRLGELKLKNKLLTALSVIIFLFAAFVNMFFAVAGSLNVFSFIISLAYIVFWAATVILTADSKAVNIYTAVVWSMTAISSVIAIIGAATAANVGFLSVPASFMIAPMVGMSKFITSKAAVFSIMLVISLLIIGAAVYNLVRLGGKKSKGA